MVTISNKRTPPFCMRVSDDERIEIARRANTAGLSMGGYCRSIILETPPPRRSRVPSLEKKELARLLGEVGRVGNNLNQIARELNAHGSVNVPELKDALVDLAEMRAAIMIALGYSENDHDADGMHRHDH